MKECGTKNAASCQNCLTRKIKRQEELGKAPEEEFSFGLVARILSHGSLDPEDVYVVPLRQLTLRSQNTNMFFGNGSERVSGKLIIVENSSLRLKYFFIFVMSSLKMYDSSTDEGVRLR